MDERRTDFGDPRAALLVMLALSACSGAEEPTASGEITGPTMRPGQDCLRCHERNSSVGAPEWFAAGTVFPHKDAAAGEGVAGVKIILTGADGAVMELTSNEVGNFFTPVPVARPFRVAIEHDGKRREMPFSPPSGGCNACHSAVPIGGAEGRLYLPDAHPSRASCADEHTLVFPTSDGSYDCSPYRCVENACSTLSGE